MVYLPYYLQYKIRVLLASVHTLQGPEDLDAYILKKWGISPGRFAVVKFKKRLKKATNLFKTTLVLEDCKVK